MRTTNNAVYFYGSADIYSNFYPAHFDSFLSTEQAFMWYKAHFFSDYKTAGLILAETDPARAKGFGRVVKNFDNEAWDCVRLGFMTYVNLLKFRQNAILAQALLDTGDRTLVEASPVDLIWGVGLAENDDRILDSANWKGQNLLGQALMQVRKIIQ